jgi:signal transduction histidine kinase
MPLIHRLRHHSITSIYMWGALVFFALVLALTVLAIYFEYRQFDADAQLLRKRYISEQKKGIVFDTHRVLRFIANEYSTRRLTVEEGVLKRQILNAISQLYGRPDGTGYIFIYDFKGTCLGDPVQTHNIGKNLYDFKDPNGVQVIKDLIDVSRQPQGGFVRYTWVKPTTKERSPKISFAQAFEPWHWMVGTGVYLDEVEKVIAHKKAALQQTMLRNFIKILGLLAVLFLIGLAGVRVVNGIIRRETESFSRFFEEASTQHIRIDVDQVHLDEFKRMAHYVNAMVGEIHKRKSRLKEINALLEEKVDEKTRSLQERNAMLAHEKEFNESLVQAQDRFIRSAIHEINTPLAVIMTHIDIYKMRNGTDRYLAKVEAGAKMIATIYDDLSYMVKKHRRDYPEEPIDFSEFLHERVRFFQEIALGNGHPIVTEIEEGIELAFSKVKLQRIIDNNLSNAIKYARKGTSILVALDRTDSGIRLTFSSHSKKIIDTEKIFEPFHREESLVEGFGLGLEIVRSICDQHHVHINVRSDKDNTVFRYDFKKGDSDADTAA